MLLSVSLRLYFLEMHLFDVEVVLVREGEKTAPAYVCDGFPLQMTQVLCQYCKMRS